MFFPPQRCSINPSAGRVTCNNLLQDGSVVLDYPTYNPRMKMQDYSFFYGISPASTTSSRWFDRVIKVDRNKGVIVASWSEAGVYPTEAGFIGRPGASAEDDGVLVSVVFNSTTNSSYGVILDSRNLRLLDRFSFDQLLPFHAHGISCVAGHCFSNP